MTRNLILEDKSLLANFKNDYSITPQRQPTRIPTLMSRSFFKSSTK